MVGVLGALRMLPAVVGHLLHGERPAKPPESMRLRDLPSIPTFWTFGVGSGPHILVGALLNAARRAAEGDRDE